MKTLLLTIVLSLFCACAFPQKITGKWDCSKETPQELQLGEEDVYGTYKFKKNGTFVLKIKGESLDRSEAFRNANPAYITRAKIVIEGEYIIKDGKISTIVAPQNIKCGYDKNDFSRLDFFKPNALVTMGILYGEEIQKESADIRDHKFAIQKLVRRCAYFWDWDNEPITITKKELVIGEKLKCER